MYFLRSGKLHVRNTPHGRTRSRLQNNAQIPMSMGQTSFVDVLLCPDIQEMDMEDEEEAQEGGVAMEE